MWGSVGDVEAIRGQKPPLIGTVVRAPILVTSAIAGAPCGFAFT
jgi:hypothetical protein